MNGTGVAVGAESLRAVRLTAGAPAVHAVEPSTRADGFVDAFIRLATHVGATVDEPVRLAWSHAPLTIVDLTGADAATAATIAGELAAHGCHAVVTVVSRRRRLAVGIDWDQADADRLAAAVRSAGFTDVTVEPASLATRRLIEQSMADAVLAPDAAAAYGAALAAAGRAGPVGSIRRLAAASPPEAGARAWVLEHVGDVPRPVPARSGRSFARFRRRRSR